MTKVTYDPAGLRILAEGHAGTCNDKGNDLACCAVSTLMFTYAQALDVHGIDGDSGADEKAGVVEIAARPDRMRLQQARTICETIAAGLELVAGEYPDNVRFTII